MIFLFQKIRFLIFAYLLSRYDSVKKCELIREQIPLILSYATTVHKSQGLTVDYVEVHAEDMLYPSLLSVAISRVRSPEGLHVTGFHKKCAVKPEKTLVDAIKKAGTTVKSDVGCCQKLEVELAGDEAEIFESDDEEFFAVLGDSAISLQETFQDTGASSATASTSTVVNPSEVQSLLLRQSFLSPVTQIQENINADIKYLKNHLDLTSTYDSLLSTIHANFSLTIDGNIKPDAANGIIFNNFMERHNRYLLTSIAELLEEQGISDKYHPYIRQMMMDMATDFFDAEARKAGEKSLASVFTDYRRPSLDAGQGVIRRVGGRAVYLARREKERRLKTLREKTMSVDYKMEKKILRCLNYMETTSEDVISGKYPETAYETERRSGRHRALTHITDESYEFFSELEKARDSYQSIGNALLQGDAVIRNTYNSILLNTQLWEKLKIAIPAAGTDNYLMQTVYKLLLRKYLPVGNNTFRKQLVAHLEKTKKLAHRPQIAAMQETTAKKRKVCDLTFCCYDLLLK